MSLKAARAKSTRCETPSSPRSAENKSSRSFLAASVSSVSMGRKARFRSSTWVRVRVRLRVRVKVRVRVRVRVRVMVRV